MCDQNKLSDKVYQFDGFSFYSSVEQPNGWTTHSHQELQITLPQANAKAWIDCPITSTRSRAKQIEAGQSFLIAPGRPHYLDWQQTAELTLFYLHPRFFSNAIGDTVEKRYLEIDEPLCLTNDALIQYIGTMFQYFRQSELATESLYVENLANLLAIHLLKKYSNYKKQFFNSQKGLSTKKLNLVLEYIETNLENRITLVDLATVAGVGKFYFCRLFKNSVNLSPYQYTLQRRVERAKKLLENSSLPIVDISYECGFSSQSHLSKHFRNMVGMTPTKYRHGIDRFG